MTNGDSTPRTQKVTSVGAELIGAARRRRAGSAWRSGRNRDGVADHDRVIADEHLLHDQAHDALALKDVQGVGGQAQPRQERREGLCQAQDDARSLVCSAIAAFDKVRSQTSQGPFAPMVQSTWDERRMV